MKKRLLFRHSKNGRFALVPFVLTPLVFLLCLMLSPAAMAQKDAPCQRFNSCTTENWTPVVTTLTVDVPGPSGEPKDCYLNVNDDPGASYIYNDVDWNIDFTEYYGACLCFDFRVFFVQGGAPVNPTIDIFTGPPGSPTLRARFTATDALTAADGWDRFCAPIDPCTDAGGLPESGPRPANRKRLQPR
ncbi:MAG: hypothetical protein AAGG75_13925 [Bacteroidota bacterium]